MPQTDRIRTLEALLFTIAIVIGTLSWSRADNAKPASTSTTTPSQSKESRLLILNAYKSAVIAQDQMQQANVRFQQRLADLNRVQAERAKADGFPEGTTWQVNADTDELTLVAAPKKEEPKPDAKDSKSITPITPVVVPVPKKEPVKK